MRRDYDKHNWYSYNKIFVPNHISVWTELLSTFSNINSALTLILSGNVGEDDDGERVNDFIKTFPSSI